MAYSFLRRRRPEESRVILLLGVISFGFVWLGAKVVSALPTTLILFVGLTLTGFWLCWQTARKLHDRALSRLGTFWLIKVALTILLLYAGWIPQLDPLASPSWGYDPQRYYQYAQEMLQSGWDPSIFSLNYLGIVYYYAAIFNLFGINPVIPALINAFVTLLGTLFLIRCAYSFSSERTPRDWTLAYLILVPEILWYDVMTSRETLMMVLFIVATIAIGRLILWGNRVSIIGTMTLVVPVLFAITAIRASMILPVLISFVIMTVLIKTKQHFFLRREGLLIALGILALIAGPVVQKFIGGYGIDYLETFNQAQSFEKNIAGQMEWSENSIGMLLAPNGLWQSVAFIPPRMLLYLAAPLPNIDVSFMEILGGSWIAWQKLMTIPTSILILLGFPYVLSASAYAWRCRKCSPGTLVIPIIFWITFAVVAGGNIIIHERYRIMFTLLLFATMWLGYTRCRRSEVRRWALPWFCLLCMGTIFYFVYKTL